MTDAERLWKWIGMRFYKAAMYCWRRSGATFTYTDTKEKA